MPRADGLDDRVKPDRFPSLCRDVKSRKSHPPFNECQSSSVTNVSFVHNNIDFVNKEIYCGVISYGVILNIDISVILSWYMELF